MTKTIDSHEGYTLVELIVVLVIFAIVMGLTTASFNRIVATSGQRISGSESEVEGLIGLEVLRSDLELAGFGLPYTFQDRSLVHYDEAKSKTVLDDFPCTNPAVYNDAPVDAPRAVISGDDCGVNGSDYLVLKGSTLGSNAASRRTSYMTYGSPQPVVRTWKNPDTDLRQLPLSQGPDVVIAVNSVNRGGVPTKELVMDPSVADHSKNYYFPFVVDLTGSPFIPRLVTDNYLVYGIAAAGTSLGAPFNRADYFIYRKPNDSEKEAPSTEENPPSGSSRCAPNTGTLYKKIMNASGTFPLTYPLLECVADMEVVYGIRQDEAFRYSDNADLYEDEVPDASGKKWKWDETGKASAADIRDHVCEIRVYILAHEGKKTNSIDRFAYSSSTVAVGIVDRNGLITAGKVFNLQKNICTDYGLPADCWKPYRWKVYTIVVHPKNF